MPGSKQQILNELLFKARNAGMPPLQVDALSQHGQDPEPFLQAWLARQSTENDAYREKERNRQRLEAMAARVARGGGFGAGRPREVPGLTREMRRGLPPVPEEARDTGLKTPGGPPSQKKEMEDEKRLRLLRAARKFREAASEFRNVTGASEVFMKKGVLPDRSRRDEDGRAEESRLQAKIDEREYGDFNNPNSEASIFARDLLKKSGIEVPDSMTAAQAKALHPQIKMILDDWSRQAVIQQKRDAEEAKARAEAGDLEAVRKGDLSRLPSDARKDLLDYKKAFYTNSRINSLKGQVDAAQSIKSRLDASKSFGPTSAFRALARAAGEVGVMTEKDIRDFAERMGIKGLYDRAYKFVKSELPPELRQEIFKVADAFAQDARNSLKAEAESRINDLTSLHPGLPREAVERFFIGPSSSTEEPEAESAPTVQVRGSDGQTYTVKSTAKVGDTFTTPEGESISVAEVYQ